MDGPSLQRRGWQDLFGQYHDAEFPLAQVGRLRARRPDLQRTGLDSRKLRTCRAILAANERFEISHLTFRPNVLYLFRSRYASIYAVRKGHQRGSKVQVA